MDDTQAAPRIDAVAEQALYSLDAMADEESGGRAKLLRACASTLRAALTNAGEPVGWQERQLDKNGWSAWYESAAPLPGKMQTTIGGIRYEWRPVYATPPAPAGTPNHAARLRDAADAVMAHQWSAPKPAMHALQVLIDTAHAVADQQGTAVTGTPAVALLVEQVFMPSGWLVVREDGMDKFLTELETVADWFVHNGWGKSPLYDQAALDAAVAAERARLAQDVADLHMAQSVNNQNYPADWHDGVDAALAVIRGA